jgi:prepilin-type N-terminal cleavage/methylation domain-containing protein
VKRFVIFPDPPRRRGLTLVEVLLALVIIGAGVAALSAAVSRCLALVTAIRNYRQARYALEQAELRYPLMPGDTEIENLDIPETEIMPGFVFSRACVNDAPDDPDRLRGLYLVRDRITWAGVGSNAAEEVLRFLYFTNALEQGQSP